MKVEWTDPAVADLAAVRDYIGRDSWIYANRFVERLIRAVDRLEEFPESGRQVPESPSPEVREIVHQGYRIIYRILSDKTEILTVVDGRRDLLPHLEHHG